MNNTKYAVIIIAITILGCEAPGGGITVKPAEKAKSAAVEVTAAEPDEVKEIKLNKSCKDDLGLTQSVRDDADYGKFVGIYHSETKWLKIVIRNTGEIAIIIKRFSEKECEQFKAFDGQKGAMTKITATDDNSNMQYTFELDGDNVKLTFEGKTELYIRQR